MTQLDPLDQPPDVDIDDITTAGPPSKIIQELRDNPKEFLEKHVIDATKFGPRQDEKDGFVGLDPIEKRSDAYYVKIYPNGGPDVIPSFTLPYLAVHHQLNNPPFVEILTTPPLIQQKTYKYVFTGGFSGCSFIVTQPDPARAIYRVFHDSRSLGSAFHRGVVMAIDDDEYAQILNYLDTGNPANIIATMFMQFNAGVWSLYCQPLSYDGVKNQITMRSPPAPIIRKTVRDGNYRPPPIIDYRAKILFEMEYMIEDLNRKRMARGVPPIEMDRGIRDGPFTRFTEMPDLDSPAVAKTRGLVYTLKSHREDTEFPLDKALREEIMVLFARRNSQDQAYLWLLNSQQ